MTRGSITLGRMIHSQMTRGRMTLCRVMLGRITFSRKTLGRVMLVRISLVKMALGRMTLGRMTLVKLAKLANGWWQNKILQTIVWLALCDGQFIILPSAILTNVIKVSVTAPPYITTIKF
jgi:hypothetical protein